MDIEAAMVAGAVGGVVAAAVNEGFGWAVLGRDSEAFAVEVNVAVAVARISAVGDQNGVAALGGVYAGLDGGIGGGWDV